MRMKGCPWERGELPESPPLGTRRLAGAVGWEGGVWRAPGAAGALLRALMGAGGSWR